MSDANRGWPVSEAVKFTCLIEKYDIAGFEEPCHLYDDARMMAQVRASTSIPIDAGQSEVRNLFVPPQSKRSAFQTHLHRLNAMAEWKAVAGSLT
ncbi:L-alanine-DL-glutamate epimerase-like enolase superfamily enzyme [Rhizobium azooxidifex]|uniref:L-alanine-DL-glutamate epimerase-like enolase superfamily enzyme n=1 Tax=Mycoplana azooxidifex TaxID=1636188 RepID=A0A7W6GN72_9HYPH|nr:L-alanine-DL-glutamate epimerase-like enolase superfamily enzyme [Mycoplana azooxidifex]